MVPYLEVIGTDPERSDERVYAAIEASGIPFRTINGTWANEVEKRRAGYAACSNRFIYRLDADELFFIHKSQLAAFLASASAFAEMQIPLYVAPGWIARQGGQGELPRCGFLFDRDMVSADAHLHHLWLVLEADALPAAHHVDTRPFPTPVAFCAHLTHWRTTETAVNRSAFYVMNWMRANGIGWFPDMKGRPVTDFRAVFARLPAQAFREALRRGVIPMGKISLTAGEVITPSPLAASRETGFADLYDRFLDRLAAQNRAAGAGSQPLIFTEAAFFDISNMAARDALTTDADVNIITSAQLAAASVRLHTLSATEPFYTVEAINMRLDGNQLSFTLPPVPSPARRVLRQAIEMVGSGADEAPMCTYRVAGPTPSVPTR